MSFPFQQLIYHDESLQVLEISWSNIGKNKLHTLEINPLLSNHYAKNDKN